MATFALPAEASAAARAESTAALRSRARFIDGERASLEFLAVQSADRLRGVFVLSHLDEGKPRDLPVSRSVMILTCCTSPNGLKSPRSASSVVLKVRFPTKRFFIHSPQESIFPRVAELM